MVGTTTATEYKVLGAEKSVFIAQHTCSSLNFIKVIQHAEVDTVEHLSLMGNFSTNFLVIATSSKNPYIPLFYQIKKVDGSIASAFYLNETEISDIIPPSYYSYKFKLISAKSP